MGIHATMTESELGRHEPDATLGVIVDERRQLLNLAYRLLGSVTEAEDVLQEAYARWYAMSEPERDAVENPGAWLNTVASRICLDQLRSARVRRERYVGEWVPEPLPGDTDWLAGPAGLAAADPADRVTLDESVSMAFLVVLESMTPAERVSFVLHDVFRYSFGEVAEIVGRSEAACRQLASSARRRIKAADVRVAPTAEQADVVRNFKRAWEAKDIGALVGLLDPDATAIGDGGGRAAAVLEPIHGSAEIARLMVEIMATVPGLTLVESVVNGQPGLLAQHHGATVTVMAFDVTDGRIKHVWSVRNPDKLRPWAAR
jgi:RNA polymerase sigma-70 factor (ECF subfamily)